MRTPAPRFTLVLLAATLALPACTFVRGTARSYDLAPSGLTRTDDAFRRALVTGGYRSAFARAATPKAGAPDDALLRALYRGLTGFYAGEYKASTDAFAVADRLAEQRVTSSLSRGALSLVASDGVLAYTPTRTERLMLRYYAMHAYARAADTNGALVEARRLGRDLEQLSAADLSSGERALHATLREAAGALFEAQHETNDALVSYRNAALLRGVSRADADSIRLTPAHGDSAMLVVFVESGFVAHRVDQGMLLGLGSSEPADSGSTRDSADSLIYRAERALDALPDGGVWGVDRTMRIGSGTASFVRVSWPALVRGTSGARRLSLALTESRASSTDIAVRADADVSSALAADFRRQRPGAIARSVARALAKGAVAEGLREKHGDWAGVLARMMGSAVERADTRSWQLLPERIGVVRLVVPAGRSGGVVKVHDDGAGEMTVSLPDVLLAAGATHVLSVRVWRSNADMGPPVAQVPDTSRLVLRTDR